MVLLRARYLGTLSKWAFLLLSASLPPDLRRLPWHLPQGQVWSTDSRLPDFKTFQGSQLHPAEHGTCVQRARAHKPQPQNHSPRPFPRAPELEHPCPRAPGQTHRHLAHSLPSLPSGWENSFSPALTSFRTCHPGDEITPPEGCCNPAIRPCP